MTSLSIIHILNYCINSDCFRIFCYWLFFLLFSFRRVYLIVKIAIFRILLSFVRLKTSCIIHSLFTSNLLGFLQLLFCKICFATLKEDNTLSKDSELIFTGYVELLVMLATFSLAHLILQLEAMGWRVFWRRKVLIVASSWVSLQ